MKDISLHLHRAIVSLAVARIIDLSSGVLTSRLLKTVEHVQTDQSAAAQRLVRVVAVDCRCAVRFVRLRKPYDLSVVDISAFVYFDNRRSVIQFPFSDHILCICTSKCHGCQDEA